VKERTKEFALRIGRLYSALPKSAVHILTRQLRIPRIATVDSLRRSGRNARM